MGGALAPVIQHVGASTGTHNEVVANYNITNLPRQQILLGTSFGDTTKGADIPKMFDDAGAEAKVGSVKLFRTSSSGTVEVTVAGGKYDHLGSYQWRFYATDDKGVVESNADKYVHMHPVQVVQEGYTMSLPQSARYGAIDGKIDGKDVVSFVPNVTVRNLDALLPMPNKFIDRKGNDLFDDYITDKDGDRIKNKDIEKLREDVITGWTGVRKPTSIGGKNLSTMTLAQLTQEENFKLLIWANTQIKFYGTDEDGDREDGRWITEKIPAPKKNSGDSNRLFRPTVPGDHYYAEYEFIHPSIVSKERTSNISVEHTGFSKEEIFGQDKDGKPSVDIAKEKQIRFEIPPAFSGSSLSTNAMAINKEFTLPLPTVNLTRETDNTKIEYNPVKFSRATSVTSYTYMTVKYWNLKNEEKTNTEKIDGKLIKDIIIDETNNYKFKPTLPGSYQFMYHTTTLFETGYTAHAAGGKEDDLIDTLGSYFRYYPHNRFHITTNDTRPEIKWSVPFKYATADDAANYGVSVGDAIALPGYEVFGVKAGDILESHGKKEFFKGAPDLIEYMPHSTDTDKPLTQISNKQAIVLPALIGFNNVGLSSELNYTIILTKPDDQSAPAITFSSTASEPSATETKPTTFKYDNTKPLILDFGNDTSKNGYGDGGHLSAWKGLAKTERYLIEVYAVDKGSEIFGVPSGDRNSRRDFFSFSVVTDSDYQSLVPDAKPELMRLNMMQTSFYEDDTIVFNKVGASDEFTLDVQVKYFIIASGMEPIELDDTFVKNDTFTFDLSRKNQQAVSILDHFDLKDPSGSGILDLNIVAVARNYFALTNAVDNSFKPIANENDLFTMDDLAQYLKNPKTFEKIIECPACNGTGSVSSVKCSTCDGEGEIDVASEVMRGIAVEAFPIKAYNQLIYGDKAAIGLYDDVTDTEKLTQAAMDAYWKTLFSEGALKHSKVYQSTQIDFPAVTIGYGCDCAVSPCDKPEDHLTYRTTVEFQIIQPIRKDLLGVDGGTTQILPIEQGTANRETINGLSFWAEEIGIHTFIVRAYNGGGYVSVFVATINVIGEPITIPVLKGGVKTMRVAEKANLPWVEVAIDGKPFITCDGSIEMDYSPYEVLALKNYPAVGTEPAVVAGNPIKFARLSTADQQLYKKVGTYTIKAESKGGISIPSGIGNFFIPVAADTYEFTYELRLDTAALNNLCISADSSVPYYKTSVRHTIIVSGLNNNDIGIAFQEKGYTTLDSIAGYQAPKATGTSSTMDIIDNTSDATDDKLKITQNNLLTQMTSSSARDISMGLQKLNNGMYQTFEGTPTLITTGSNPGRINWEPDKYEFGRIYLPNMYAEWGGGLTPLNIFDLPNASRVTVSHSRRSGDLFDSQGINENHTGTERKYIKTGADGKGDTYYWFQPAGSVYVPKPIVIAENTAGFPAKPTAPYTLDYDKKTGNLLHIQGGVEYFWNVDGQHWYSIDYDKENYQNTKYGYGNTRFVDPNVTPDGVYEVTYSIVFGGITSEVKFKISVGDTATPIIEFAKAAGNGKYNGIEYKAGKSWEEILFGESYKLDSEFSFNTSDAIRVMPNGGRLNELESDGSFARWYVAKNLKITVLLPGGHTDLNKDEIDKRPESDDAIKPQYEKGSAGDKMDEWGYKLVIKPGCTECEGECEGHRVPNTNIKEDRTWSFTLAESGEYRVTFEIQSESGQTAYLTRIITVDPKPEQRKVSPQTIWGTILIIVAAGLLLGVVVYFVQTGRKTKFASSQLKAKKTKGVKSEDGEV